MSQQSEFEKYAIKHRGISSLTLHDYNRHSVEALTPNIIEERPMNVAVMDVYSRLMMDRIIFLGYPVNDEVANIVTAQLLFLDSSDHVRDINMYINSPGGSVYAGLGIYDTMQYVSPDFYYLYRHGRLYGSRTIVCGHPWQTCCAKAFARDDAPA